MTCRNCGKENREDAAFCSYCGKKLIEVTPETEKAVEAEQCLAENEGCETDPVRNQDAAAFQDDIIQKDIPDDAGVYKKKKIRMIPVIISVIVVLTVLVIGGIALSGTTDTGYEAVLEDVKTGLEENDFSLIMGSFPDEYFDSISAFWSYFGADEDNTEEFYAQLYEGATSLLGYTCEITDSTVQKCNADDIEDVTDAIRNNYYVDVEIERMRKAKLDCTLTLYGTEMTRTITLYLGKVDGEWYLVYSEGLFD